MRVRRPETPKARIEIIPMIDVIFFLLVFFMISTLSMTINRGLPVTLPTAGSAQSSLRDTLTLTLTRDGDLFVDQAPLALADLGPQVQAALAAAPHLLVLIQADGEVRHSAVVAVLDALRQSGVSAMAIAVHPEALEHP